MFTRSKVDGTQQLPDTYDRKVNLNNSVLRTVVYLSTLKIQEMIFLLNDPIESMVCAELLPFGSLE